MPNTSQFNDVRLHIRIVVGKRLYAVCVQALLPYPFQ